MRRYCALLAALVMLFTACSKPSPDPSPPPGSFVTIRFLGREGPVFDDLIISAFHREHPGIRVERITLDGFPQERNEAAAALLREDRLDVFLDAVVWSFPEELVLDLQPLMRRDRVQPPVYTEVQGTVRSLPVWAAWKVLLYNPEMVRDRPMPGWTWEDLRGTLGALATAGSTPMALTHPISLWEVMLEQQPTLARVPEPQQVLRGLMLLDSLLRDGLLVAEPEGAHRHFELGRAAVTENFGITAAPVFPQQQVPWDYAPFPGTGGSVLVQHHSVRVNAVSSKREAAWTFARYLASEQAAITLAESGFLPAQITPGVKEAYRRLDMPPGFMALLDAPQKTRQKRLPEDQPVWQKAREIGELVLLGERSAEAAYTEYLAVYAAWK